VSEGGPEVARVVAVLSSRDPLPRPLSSPWGAPMALLVTKVASILRCRIARSLFTSLSSLMGRRACGPPVMADTDGAPDGIDDVMTGGNAARGLGPWSTARDLEAARDDAVRKRQEADDPPRTKAPAPAWQPWRDPGLPAPPPPPPPDEVTEGAVEAVRALTSSDRRGDLRDLSIYLDDGPGDDVEARRMALARELSRVRRLDPECLAVLAAGAPQASAGTGGGEDIALPPRPSRSDVRRNPAPHACST